VSDHPPQPSAPRSWIGQPVKRVEDARLLSGRGNFIDDLSPCPNLHHAAIVRSPHAHARIVGYDVSDALAMEGVVGVLTGDDVARMSKPFSVGVPAPVRYYCTATDKARFVGEPVAVVVARDRYLAEDAAEAVVVRYEDASDEGRLEALYAVAYDLGLDFAVDVREEEALEEALERIDPEIVLISERGLDDDQEDLELTLDLLADVPAGKLVVSEARIASHEQVLALERAGVDAILVHGLAGAPAFGAVLEELVHGPAADR